MTQVLDKELATYEQQRDHLLATAEGKFVLIYGEEILGIYETKMDAITQGYTQLGHVPFLVKQVVQIEIPETFVSNHLGL